MKRSSRYSRQSFLGRNSPRILSRTRVGIIGLGGGGSHVVQQLAHLGFTRYCLYDGDHVENSNLNRLIGATETDARRKRAKIDVAKRLIRGLQSKANINGYKSKWQENPEPLKRCAIVFGCVDGFQQRRELEIFCRRYKIILIDIGLDVHPHPKKGGAPSLAGQIMLSVPKKACLRCYQYLTDAKIDGEVAKYGAAGINPQVVWANGILASTAVGIAVDLLTNWTKRKSGNAYFSYNGNDGTLTPHVRLGFMPETCTHHMATGEPRWTKV